MASLIIQDTFEPYYVGRDGASKEPKSGMKKPARSDKETAIVLPADKRQLREDRGVTEH